MTEHEPEHLQQSTDSGRGATRVAAKRIDRVNEWLHVGGALPPEEYARLSQAGITHVIDLREETVADAGRLKELGLIRQHVPVADHGSPTIEQLTSVAACLAKGDEPVSMYVHCKGGFGRAATMAVGLLVAHGVGVDDALEQVRKARPEMRINDEQLAWLRIVEDRLSQNRKDDRA